MNGNINGQPQNVTPVTPAAITPVVPAAPRQPMDKKEIMKWVGVGCGLAIVIALFLPFISAGGESRSLFSEDTGLDLTKFVMLILGVVAAGTHFLGKAKSLSYLASAYTLAIINMMGDSGIFEYADHGFGWYILLIGALGLIVVNIMDDMDSIKSLFAPKNPATPMAPVAPVAPVAPTAPTSSFVNVAPVAPVAPVVEPVAQAAVVCSNCGQPKKNPADQFCQGCGQRF